MLRPSLDNRPGRLPLAWLWLLLVSIAAHATLPVGSPVARGSGSAFSATTIEVALAPKRKAGPAEAAFEADAGSRDTITAGSAGDDPYLPPAHAALALPWPVEAATQLAPAPTDVIPSAPRAFRARAPPAA